VGAQLVSGKDLGRTSAFGGYGVKKGGVNPFASVVLYIRPRVLTDPLSIYTQLYLFLRPDLKSR
jgi:hypothetical protein